MRSRWAAIVAAVTACAVLSAGTAAAGDGSDRSGNDGGDRARAFTFAVIGDTPYGTDQIAQFPRVIDQINAEAQVLLVEHLGDIKSGSSRCTDQYFSDIKTQFDRVADPLVYTPGDNEWTGVTGPTTAPTTHWNGSRGSGRFSSQTPVTPSDNMPSARPRPRGATRRTWPTKGPSWAFAALQVVGSNNSLAPGHGALRPHRSNPLRFWAGPPQTSD